jgi:hypothetical protein
MAKPLRLPALRYERFDRFTSDGRFLGVNRAVPTQEPGLLKKWLGSILAWPSPTVNAMVVVIELADGRERLRLEMNEVLDIHLAEDGGTLVTTHLEGNDSVIRCWDLPSRPPLRWVIGIPFSLGAVVVLFRGWRGRRTKQVAALR